MRHMHTDLTDHIGVDEAGRGCLAGPVVAAAVLFPAGCDTLALLPELADSKQCSVATRNRLAPLVKQQCAAWRIGISWPAEIDEVNILNATFRAMSRAVSRLRLADVLPPLAVDGNHRIRKDAWYTVTTRPLPEQVAVIGGDATVPAISAASILAKVFRDAFMEKMHARWPLYGFGGHKGYGTREHVAAIAEHGPCPIHRKTFRGVRTEEQQFSLF